MVRIARYSNGERILRAGLMLGNTRAKEEVVGRTECGKSEGGNGKRMIG